MHSTRTTFTALWSLLLLLGAVPHARAQAPTSSPPAQLPPLASLGEGWHTMEPRGDSACAATRDYRHFVRPGDPTRLLIYLTGGGACWNGKDCDPTAEDPPYAHSIRPNREPGRLGGIFDLRDPRNPLVWVPACTGDVHLGDRDAA
jgi:hypothetical protein